MQDKTLTESGFYWREAGGIQVLVCKPLEEAGFANGFSTRTGGVSQMSSDEGGDLNLAGYDEDTAENIEENRRRFLALFDPGFRLSSVWQVHGDGVKLLRYDADVESTNEKYDALASAMPGLLVGVKTADCVPVLIGDPKTGAYSAVHAGWRGTVQSIVSKAVGLLKREFGSDPTGLIAAIGPAACGRNYEIGEDVIKEFKENFSDADKYFTATREGHALIDLHDANQDQLIAAGIRAGNIYTAPYCTMERTDLFFSYRVEKRKYGKTGRLMSVIGRKPEAI